MKILWLAKHENYRLLIPIVCKLDRSERCNMLVVYPVRMGWEVISMQAGR